MCRRKGFRGLRGECSPGLSVVEAGVGWPVGVVDMCVAVGVD